MPDPAEPPSEEYIYTFNDEFRLCVHTDPAGLWHAGVAATVWDSSLILAKHFEKIVHGAPSLTGTALMTKLMSRKSFKILELGAGCSALPSLVLVRLMASAGQREVTSVVTDKKSSLPLLVKTIENTEFGRLMKVHELDWNTREHSVLGDARWDIILASDLLAFPELYESLDYTLKRLSDGNTLVYIAYERRDFSAEVEFFRVFGENYTFEMVPENELDDVWRAPGEIYLYRASLRSKG